VLGDRRVDQREGRRSLGVDHGDAGDAALKWHAIPDGPAEDCVACETFGGRYNWACRACRVRWLVNLPADRRRMALKDVRANEPRAVFLKLRDEVGAELDRWPHATTDSESVGAEMLSKEPRRHPAKTGT
jgi:hypothetical protein